MIKGLENLPYMKYSWCSTQSECLREAMSIFLTLRKYEGLKSGSKGFFQSVKQGYKLNIFRLDKAPLFNSIDISHKV